MLEKSGYNRLKAKHPRFKIDRFPDLSVEQRTAPTSDLSGARGGSTAKRQMPHDAKRFPVGNLHKQGPVLMSPDAIKNDLQWYSGKKS